jgi:Tol biopolymer transport system component/serine/threonine protein kinase
MALNAGQTLLHYRLVEQIGQGGMGVVWKALDTTLDREVAVKFLPDGLGADPERLARFEREAKTLATLNHPHIAGIYGLHEADVDPAAAGPVRFLAMELVPGEDLSTRLERGALPLDEALEVAIQIAEALTAAHDSGVIHRDLKPANVRAAPDGRCRVLDFGLAKAIDASSASGSSPAAAPTMTSAGTAAGIILGTASYMSPEQARGREVDRQTDVWAFGCLLYELLTAKMAFDGETMTDVLAAVVRAEPDYDALPAEVPPVVRYVIERCLRKNSRERLRDLGDIALTLREVTASATSGLIDAGVTDPSIPGFAANGSASATAPRPAAVPTPSVRIWQGATLVSLIALAGVAAMWLGESSGNKDVGGPKVTSISQITDLAGDQQMPALSADAGQLLFAAVDGGDLDIFQQRVGGERPVNLTENHSSDDFDPAYSPDGKRVAFVSDRGEGGVFVMGATGESPQRVLEAGYDPAWSPDGTRLVVTSEPVQSHTSRSTVASLTIVDLTDNSQQVIEGMDAVAPSWSPNDQRIAFWTVNDGGQRDIGTVRTDGTDPVRLTTDRATDWAPVWSADGRFIYFLSDRGGSADLWRVRIDEATGTPQSALEAVTNGIANMSDIGISADGGSIALRAVTLTGAVETGNFDRQRGQFSGPVTTTFESSTLVIQASLAPDGQSLVFAKSQPREMIIVASRDGLERRTLIDDGYHNRGPQFSSDGRWIIFYTDRSGPYAVWAIRPDGSGLRRISKGDQSLVIPVWMPDGQRILTGYFGDGGTGLAVLDLGLGGIDGLQGQVAANPLAGTESLQMVSVSPDGRRVLAIETKDVARDIVQDLETGNRVGLPGSRGSWLDDQRVVSWSETEGTAVIQNIETGERQVVPDSPYRGGIIFTPDRKSAAGMIVETTSDIWLLTFDR